MGLLFLRSSVAAAPASSLAQDWIDRSTAGTVTTAIRFDTTAAVTDYRHGAGTANSNNAVYRNPIGGILGDGCLRIDIAPGVGTSQYLAWRHTLNDLFTSVSEGFGTNDFYIQFRAKVNQAWLTASVGGGGTKLLNISGYDPQAPNSSASFTGHEIVIGNEGWGGFPRAYTRNNLGDVEHLYEDAGGGDFRMQSALATCLFSQTSVGNTTGCWNYPVDEWFTILIHVKVGTFGGTTGNLFEMWAAANDQSSYTKLFETENFEIDTDATYTGGHNGMWPSAFDTGRTSHTETVTVEYDQFIVSTATIPCPVPGTTAPLEIPSWATTPFEGFWDTIGNNVPDDVDPDPTGAAAYAGTTGFASITDNWNGAAFIVGYGVSGTLAIWGGGHNNYYGNEIPAIDLSTQDWALLTQPYPSTSFPISGGWWPAHTGHPDGSPSVAHTYGFMHPYPPTNSFICLVRQAVNTGASLSAPAIFDFDTLKWRKGATYAGTGDPTEDDGGAAYDSIRKIVWTRGGQTGAAFASFDPLVDNGDGTWGEWTQYADQGSESGTMLCHDPNLDILIMIRGVDSQSLYGINCSTPNTARTTLTQSNRPTLATRVGVVYSRKRKAFIVWDSGENIWELKKGVGSWSAATWTWTNIVHASNTVSPTANINGTYTKMQIAPYGDREIVMVTNETAGPTYVFEVPTP